jgi:hypothetical protein
MPGGGFGGHQPGLGSITRPVNWQVPSIAPSKGFFKYPFPDSILRGARTALNVQNTEAAAATASIAAAHIAEPVLARAAEYMIPVAGEALTISQGLLASSDADKAYWDCLKQ